MCAFWWSGRERQRLSAGVSEQAVLVSRGKACARAALRFSSSAPGEWQIVGEQGLARGEKVAQTEIQRTVVVSGAGA